MNAAKDLRPVHVLLVEDDEVEVMALRRALRFSRAPHSLVVARDGVEAVAILRGDGCASLQSPALIFLDLNMPRMNGLEFLRVLRADSRHSRTDVFVVTTSLAEEDQRQAWGERIAGYIVKSTFGASFQDFAREIDACLERSYITQGHVGARVSQVDRRERNRF